MTKTSELEEITHIFSLLGRREALNMLANSNLSDRDQKLLALRFVKGLSLDECAEYFCMCRNSVGKWQTKVARKLYQWIENRREASVLLHSINLQSSMYSLSEKIERSIKRDSLSLEKSMEPNFD